MNKDTKQLMEAYERVLEMKKHEHCKYAEEGCECDKCDECKENKKPVSEKKKAPKPDYLDVDEDGDEKESMKKALKDKKSKK